jgi:hypothetical protein
LEQHVVHLEVVRYEPAIVSGSCFGMSVAHERNTIQFIDALGDSRAGV